MTMIADVINEECKPLSWWQLRQFSSGEVECGAREEEAGAGPLGVGEHVHERQSGLAGCLAGVARAGVCAAGGLGGSRGKRVFARSRRSAASVWRARVRPRETLAFQSLGALRLN